MKLLFIGCVESSCILLQTLIEERREICGVITKEESKINSDFADLTPLCTAHNIPYKYVQDINDEDSRCFIEECGADYGICAGWSQLIKTNVIDMFPKGIIGFHPSELPKNRGRHPLIWALCLGLEETASSFFMISAEADGGDVISQHKISISYTDDARSLYDRVMVIARLQILEITELMENNGIMLTNQNKQNGNTWRKRGVADGRVDWRMSSRSIYNLVRALTHPYVGAHMEHNGHIFKIWKVEEVDAMGCENMEPGKVLKVDDGGMIVKTGENAIRLLEYDSIDIREGEYLL